ncbi:MAG: hypothetical protein ABIN58_11160 [candidate division WOR-3 bacterium]
MEGFQPLQIEGFLSPYFLLRDYCSPRLFGEIKAGMVFFNDYIYWGALPGPESGTGILTQISIGYRFADPKKRNCCLGIWDIISGKANESDELCCLYLGRLGPPDILFGFSYSAMDMKDREEDGINYSWEHIWALHLGLSFPLVMHNRDVGDVYWTGLLGDTTSYDTFTFTTPWAGGFNLWFFNWGAEPPDQDQEEDQQEDSP